jgi:hypothetical protein
MAPTYIELYESLKKDVSEESARMIAEALWQSGDAATKADIDRLESGLKSYIDSRLLRYTAVILVPVALTMLATVGALFALVAKL